MYFQWHNVIRSACSFQHMQNIFNNTWTKHLDSLWFSAELLLFWINCPKFFPGNILWKLLDVSWRKHVWLLFDIIFGWKAHENFLTFMCRSYRLKVNEWSFDAFHVTYKQEHKSSFSPSVHFDIWMFVLYTRSLL